MGEEKQEKQEKINNVVGSAVLAELFSLSERRIQQLTGPYEYCVFESLSKKAPFQYSLINSVRSFIRYQQEQIDGKASRIKNAEKEGEKLDIDIQLKELKLKSETLVFDELEGKMHRSEDVEYMTSDLVLTIRSMLLALAPRCSDNIVGLEDVKEIENILGEEVHQILERLSEYQYDPKKYRDRLMERNKQDVADDEEETG